MNRLRITIVCALIAGCAAAPDTTPEEQALCQLDLDNCPGGAITHQQQTVIDTQNTAAYYGYTIREIYSGCNTAGTRCFCNAFIADGNLLQTTCYFDASGAVSCSHQLCVNSGDGYVCHDIPPLY